MTTVARNTPPQPASPMPRFQPEKSPEMTAATPRAHGDQAPAWRVRPRAGDVVPSARSQLRPAVRRAAAGDWDSLIVLVVGRGDVHRQQRPEIRPLARTP